MKSITYPVGLPEDLYSDIQRTAEQTKLSMADAIRQSIKLGLPTLREKLSTNQRVTNVDPWPDKTARALYRLPDDDTDSIEQFMKAQAVHVDE